MQGAGAATQYAGSGTSEVPSLTPGHSNRETETSTTAAKKKEKRGFWDRVEDGAEWVGDKAQDSIEWVGDKAEDTWEAATAAWNYADEFVDLFVALPDEEQRNFLWSASRAIAELNPALGVISDIERLINDPAARTATNIAIMVASIVPIFRAGRIGIKIKRLMDQTMRKWKRLKKNQPRGRNKDPLDRDRQQVSASGQDRDRFIEEDDSFDGIFRHTPKIPDVLKGSIEAIATEAFDIFIESLGAAIGPAQEKPLASKANLKRIGTAAASGGAAGLSAGFQSDDQAEFAVKLVIASFGTAFHVWSMQSIKGNSDVAGLQAAGTISITGLAGVVKILSFGVFTKGMSRIWGHWPPAARRRASRWIKIAINKIADSIAEEVLSTIFGE